MAAPDTSIHLSLNEESFVAKVTLDSATCLREDFVKLGIVQRIRDHFQKLTDAHKIVDSVLYEKRLERVVDYLKAEQREHAVTVVVGEGVPKLDLRIMRSEQNTEHFKLEFECSPEVASTWRVRWLLLYSVYQFRRIESGFLPDVTQVEALWIRKCKGYLEQESEDIGPLLAPVFRDGENWKLQHFEKRGTVTLHVLNAKGAEQCQIHFDDICREVIRRLTYLSQVKVPSYLRKKALRERLENMLDRKLAPCEFPQTLLMGTVLSVAKGTFHPLEVNAEVLESFLQDLSTGVVLEDLTFYRQGNEVCKHVDSSIFHIPSLHKTLIETARERVQIEGAANKVFVGTTLAISDYQATLVVKFLEKFLTTAQEFSKSSVADDEVFHLCVEFFPFTVTPSKRTKAVDSVQLQENTWAQSIIREMVGLDHFQGDANWIQSHLTFPLSQSQIENALRNLEKLGMVHRDEKTKKYKLTKQQISTASEVSGENIVKFHRDIMEASIAAIEIFPDTRAFCKSLTMRLNKSGFKLLHNFIDSETRKTLEFEDTTPQKDQIYQLAVQCFPFQKPGG